jgi:hypothetical protein
MKITRSDGVCGGVFFVTINGVFSAKAFHPLIQIVLRPSLGEDWHESAAWCA